MATRDPGRAWIERNLSVPVISYDWSAGQGGLILPSKHTKHGMIEEWDKVKEKLKERRSRAPTDSDIHKACEVALGLVAYITKAGEVGAIHGDWRPSHQILRDVANIYEARVGRIDPLVQAMIREAMDETYVEERFGQ